MERAAISLLTVCGLEELDGHRERRVTHALSILDPGWPDPSSFESFPPHRRTILRFHDIIEDVPGQIAPTRAHVDEILAFGEGLAAEAHERDEGHLLIHCHMGISRSTAAMLMLLAQNDPTESGEALGERLVAIRPQAWPNARMTAFADEALGRGGDLARAATRLHARQLADKPRLAQVMSDLGRAREVEAALAFAA
ncbi:MAG: protein-tyrosine-phosphatase [Methylobacteriaceae bacterium]|nr:protein-tyrosine-phosphatase [Methylobacteriaceae bacterium]